MALIGGILGFETDDLRIPDADKEREIEVEFIEEDANAPHPNTAKFVCIKERKKLKLLHVLLVVVKSKW